MFQPGTVSESRASAPTPTVVLPDATPLQTRAAKSGTKRPRSRGANLAPVTLKPPPPTPAMSELLTCPIREPNSLSRSLGTAALLLEVVRLHAATNPIDRGDGRSWCYLRYEDFQRSTSMGEFVYPTLPHRLAQLAERCILLVEETIGDGCLYAVTASGLRQLRSQVAKSRRVA